MYSLILGRLSVVKKRLLADSGAFSDFMPLLGHRNPDVVTFASMSMEHLIRYRQGEEYARFIEEGLFEELMQYFPSHPEQATIAVPFDRNRECYSNDFTALGLTWFAPPFSSSVSCTFHFFLDHRIVVATPHRSDPRAPILSLRSKVRFSHLTFFSCSPVVSVTSYLQDPTVEPRKIHIRATVLNKDSSLNVSDSIPIVVQFPTFRLVLHCCIPKLNVTNFPYHLPRSSWLSFLRGAH
jgi:hypothetical protein